MTNPSGQASSYSANVSSTSTTTSNDGSSSSSSSSNSLSLNNINGEINVLGYLLSFYGHKRLRKKTWGAKTAQVACLDYFVKAILRMAGGSEDQKKTAEDNIVLCFSLGSFNTQTGLAQSTQRLKKRLVIRAKSFGYVMLGAHGYYTSAKCPRLDCNQFLV
ncbi:hypothetical protein BC939DRAFT_499830 [Gamsiella multidivaricata]|uniref:uncharacterized protein n=1 Tax=Gamsiella multidivaricata TaxID=101098 RepID=UPI00221E4B1D|nr:uncharacterized protein BC939DRAFT_499830 [Gamsiella multidivaricata]KAI7829704.1 hypothetical protein BC939DRAFT_499830 [Gamsiella multidivaricata]